MSIPTLDSDKTIFLVDDDEDLRRLVGLWLQQAGYTVQEFSSGEPCLDGLKITMPGVVLMDLNMPGLGGVATLERIKQHHRFLPVIVLTVERETETIVSTMQKGAYDFLVKPLNRSKLLTTIANATEQHRMALRLAQLEREVAGGGFPGLVGSSVPMKELMRQIERLAASDISVYIRGESGTGKELVARAVHENSGRHDGPFVALNCAAIAESLQESEFFGHERGSFTGAANKHTGKFEQAHGGTLFLDEVAELSLSLQSKLLRVLQERRFQRVGGTQEVSVDFRLLAATHRNLLDEVRAHRFREDLYFRIVVFELEIPPLRDRTGDCLQLIEFFLQKFGRHEAGKHLRMSSAALELCERYGWPGNVRELENAVQRAMVSCSGEEILPNDLPPTVRGSTMRAVDGIKNGVLKTDVAPAAQAAAMPSWGLPMTLADMEKQVISLAMQRCEGNRSLVAVQLGIGRTTLYRKLKEYGIE